METALLANETQPFALAGSRFYYQSGDAPIRVVVNGGRGQKTFKLRVGQSINYGNDRFNSIEIVNLDTPQDIEFEVYERELEDSAITGTLAVSLIHQTDGETEPDSTIADGITVTIPADTSRRKVVIWNDIDDSSGHIRVGYDAAAGVGYKLQPGGSYTFESTRSVSIHNDSGATQTFGYSIETD